MVDLDLPPHIVLPTEPLRLSLCVLSAAQPPAQKELLTSKLVIGRVSSCRATPRAGAWFKLRARWDDKVEDPVQEIKMSLSRGE